MSKKRGETKVVRISSANKGTDTMSIHRQQLLLFLFVDAVIDQMKKMFRGADVSGRGIITAAKNNQLIELTVGQSGDKDLGWVEGALDAALLRFHDDLNYAISSVNVGAEASTRATEADSTLSKLRVVPDTSPGSLPFLDSDGNVVAEKDPRPIVRRLWQPLISLANAQGAGLEVAIEIGESKRTIRRLEEAALQSEYVPTQLVAVLAKMTGYLPRKRVAEFKKDGADMEMKVPPGCDAILKSAQQTGALLRLKIEVASISNPALPSDSRETLLEVETAMDSFEM